MSGVRREIDQFLKSDKNTFDIKLKSFSGRTIHFCFMLEEVELPFSLQLDVDAIPQKVETEDEDLKGQWALHMNKFITEKKRTIGEILEKASEEFDSTIEEDEEQVCDNAEEDEPATPFSVSSFSFGSGNPFVVETPNTIAMKRKQKEALQKYYQSQINNTIRSHEIGSVIKSMTNTAKRDLSKKAEKIMYLRFFSDGFTIDDGQLRNMDDPFELKLLESLQSGYVPSSLCGQAKEVDVHVIWENGKHEDYLERKAQKEKIEKQQADDVDEIEKQILEQIKRQTLQEYCQNSSSEQVTTSVTTSNAISESSSTTSTTMPGQGRVLGSSTATATTTETIQQTSEASKPTSKLRFK